MREAPRYSIADIKAMLYDRRHDLAETYAPKAPGSYLSQGAYYTLNPGRPDRHVGSFVIWLEGARAGRWQDFATGEHGDLLDLIALALGCDLSGALREARGYLGLMADGPEDIARRKRAAEEARRRSEEAAANDAAVREARRRKALALWLEAEERIAGTPVEAYLHQARGIDLRALGRQPRALRYHPACYFREVTPERVDPETGEVLPERLIEGHYPAMMALVTGPDGRPAAVHRTYLVERARQWVKAPLRAAKKVLGDYAGGSIHLWSGQEPDGSKGRPLAEAPPGSRVYVSEGIEDALSCVVLIPEARVLAAVSLSNMGAIALPPAISEIVLIGDRDEGEQQRAALARAVETHAQAGRRVRLWLSDSGKDLNDALRQGGAAEEADQVPAEGPAE